MIEAGLWAFLGQASLFSARGSRCGGTCPAGRWARRRVRRRHARRGAPRSSCACPATARPAAASPRSRSPPARSRFYVADRLVARHAPPGEHGSVGIALGALLDGIPESVAIAISLIGGSTVSGPMVAAVLASNLPEGMASTPGFRRAGWPTGGSSACGSAIALAGAVAAMIGRVLLGDASADVLGAINAFAAGTILTMIASVMLPTAFQDGREAVGLVFVLGFACLGGLTTLGA